MRLFVLPLTPYEGQGYRFFNYKESRKKPFVDTVKKIDAVPVSMGYLQGPDRVAAFG